MHWLFGHSHDFNKDLNVAISMHDLISLSNKLHITSISFEYMLPYVTFSHLGWNKTLEFLRSCDMVFTPNLSFLKVGFRIFNYLKTSVAIDFIHLITRAV